jgi:hypothetical protein
MYLYITGFVMYIIHIYMYLYITGFVMYIIHIYIYISGLSRFMHHATGNWGLTSWAERGSSMLVSSYNCYDIKKKIYF